MNEKIQERNENFLRCSSESSQDSNKKFAISLRKGKRLSLMLSKRNIAVSEETLLNSSKLFNSTDQNDSENINNPLNYSERPFLSKIKNAKDIIQSSSNHIEFYDSLEIINEIISKYHEDFPFFEYFDDQMINLYKSLLTQNENKPAATQALNTLINTFAHNEQIGDKFLDVGIIEILIDLSKSTDDVKTKASAVNAIGNVHNMKQEITDYFISAKYWQDLLEFISLNDKDLNIMSVWCLCLMYKTEKNPDTDISNIIMTKLQSFFDSKDALLLKEFLTLLSYLTRKDSYTVHSFVNRNYHVYILRYFGIPNTDILNPSYRIISNLIRHSESITTILIDLTFASRISVSFQNKNSTYQKLSLSIYSLMLSKDSKIALRLMKGETFSKFIKEHNSNPTSNLTILEAIHTIISFKNEEINQLLLEADILLLLISSASQALDQSFVLILKSLIELFGFYSKGYNEKFNILLTYFRELNGEVLLNHLYLSKVDEIHNYAGEFIKLFLEEENEEDYKKNLDKLFR